jgi:hypothetical protein
MHNTTYRGTEVRMYTARMHLEDAARTGLVPAPHDDRLFSPGPWVRLAARLRAAALDRALAAGADPSASRLLAARALALTAPAARRELAGALEVVLRGRHSRSRRRLAPPRAAVDANAETLSELAALLRSGAPLYARGLARVAMLITDGTGPLYARCDDAALAAALRAARAALPG